MEHHDAYLPSEKSKTVAGNDESSIDQSIFNVDPRILTAMENMSQMIVFLQYELENEKQRSKMLEERMSLIKNETIESTSL